MTRKTGVDIQIDLRTALSQYLEFGDDRGLRRLVDTHPELVSPGFGEYPDLHRLVDVRIGEKKFRACRQISRGEVIVLAPVDEVLDMPGVPLWLTGEKLALWASDEEENPTDEPTDWERYR